MDEKLPFDAETIRSYAQRVNRAAGRQVFGWMVIGLLSGAAAGVVFANAIDSAIFFNAFTAVIGGAAGLLIGDAHSELMQLNARVALSELAREGKPTRE